MRNAPSRPSSSLVLLPLAFAVFASTGCQSPTTLSTARAPSQLSVSRASAMSVEEAEATLAALWAKPAASELNDALHAPKTLADALAILRTDQVDLYGKAVEAAKADGSVKGMSVAAQLQLSWGDNFRVIAEVLELLGHELREEVRDLGRLVASGKGTAEDRARLDRLDALAFNQSAIIAALSRLAPEHVREGAAIAESLVKTAASDYEGYRVMADYHRMCGDWASFDAMVKEVEQRHPTSTGLLYLKAISDAERKGDFEGAIKGLRAAIAKQPSFVAAQAQIVFMTAGFGAKFDEFKKLQAMNPNHPLVTIAAPIFEAVGELRESRKRRQVRVEGRSFF
jgi:hypothetical protein